MFSVCLFTRGTPGPVSGPVQALPKTDYTVDRPLRVTQEDVLVKFDLTKLYLCFSFNNFIALVVDLSYTKRSMPQLAA